MSYRQQGNKNNRYRQNRPNQRKTTLQASIEEEKKLKVYSGQLIGRVIRVEDLDYHVVLRWSDHNIASSKIPLNLDGEDDGCKFKTGDTFQCQAKVFKEKGKVTFEFKKNTFELVKDDREFPYRVGVVVVFENRLLLLSRIHKREMAYVGLGWILSKVLSGKIRTREEVEFVLSNVDFSCLVREEYDLLKNRESFRNNSGLWYSSPVHFPTEATTEAEKAYLDVLEQKLSAIKVSSLKSLAELPTVYRNCKGKNEFCPKSKPTSDQDSFVESALHQLKYETGITRVTRENFSNSFIKGDTLYFVFDSPMFPRHIKLTSEFTGYQWFFLDRIAALKNNSLIDLPESIDQAVEVLKQFREEKSKREEEQRVEEEKIEEPEEDDGWTKA